MINKPIRIAQIIGKWAGGGVEAIVMNYYKNLDHDKIQFDFICDNDSIGIPYEEIESLGGKVILISPYQRPISYHKDLRKVLKNGNYKIVHSHISTMSFFSLFAAKMARIPIRIAHSHSTTNSKEKNRNFMKQILKHLSKVFATDYFCCSELSGRWLFGNKVYNQGKVFLMNNAISLENICFNEKVRSKKRKELNIEEDFLVVGHIGRFVSQKNHIFLINVFYELYKKNSHSILLLVGRGPLQNKIEKKIKDLHLQNHVFLLGQRKDVYELCQAMDVFVLPSLYEGLPLVGVEAQAAGLPCILSEDMTKEVKLLESTQFLSLQQSPEIWANTILKTCKNFKRKNSITEVSDKGFNIKYEAKKLENKYLKLFER